MLHHLVRGTAVLTRVLRRRGVTKPMVRAVPAIVNRTVRSLKNQARAGKPITRTTAAKTMAVQTRKVLSNPTTCAKAVARNVTQARTAARAASRPAARPVRR